MTTQTVDGLSFTLGDRLRKARIHAELEQEDMAKKFGVTTGTISNWETGRGQPRNLPHVLEVWEDLTGVSAQWLMFGWNPGGRIACFPDGTEDAAMRLSDITHIVDPELPFSEGTDRAA